MHAKKNKALQIITVQGRRATSRPHFSNCAASWFSQKPAQVQSHIPPIVPRPCRARVRATGDLFSQLSPTAFVCLYVMTRPHGPAHCKAVQTGLDSDGRSSKRILHARPSKMTLCESSCRLQATTAGNYSGRQLLSHGEGGKGSPGCQLMWSVRCAAPPWPVNKAPFSELVCVRIALLACSSQLAAPKL
jgi:hypothetical protein